MIYYIVYVYIYIYIYIYIHRHKKVLWVRQHWLLIVMRTHAVYTDGCIMERTRAAYTDMTAKWIYIYIYI